jgi:hypothetical protein
VPRGRAVQLFLKERDDIVSHKLCKVFLEDIPLDSGLAMALAELLLPPDSQALLIVTHLTTCVVDSVKDGGTL